MEDRKTIHVEGATQDEALATAQAYAKEHGYAKVSLKNIVKLTYSAEMYEPIETPQEPAPEA